MARARPVGKTKKRGSAKKRDAAKKDKAGGFINVAVSRATRQGLHLLKESMGVHGQAEVIERLVAIGLAIHLASR